MRIRYYQFIKFYDNFNDFVKKVQEASINLIDADKESLEGIINFYCSIYNFKYSSSKILTENKIFIGVLISDTTKKSPYGEEFIIYRDI